MITELCVAWSCGLVLTVGAPSVAEESGGRQESRVGRCHVGCRDGYLSGLGEADIWSAAEAVGIKRLEVAVREDMSCPNLFENERRPYRIDTPQVRAQLAKKLAERSQSIAAFTTVVKFGRDAEQARTVAWVARVAEAAREMNVPVVMIPIVAKDLSDQEFVQRSIRLVKALAPVAGRTGVQLTVENLGAYLNRREILEPILKAAPTDRVGLALDITNMYWFGHPLAKVYELAETFAPYVRYVHVKNLRYPPDKRQVQRPPGWQYAERAERVKTGDIDFARIIRILSRAGFRGDLTLEDDSLRRLDEAGKRKVLRDDAELLRQLIAEVHGG